MSFFSTRGGAAVTASQAILYGLAPDGGLYVPAMFPPISQQKLAELTNPLRTTRSMSLEQRT